METTKLTKARACSAYVPASGVYGPCTNGFPQTAFCMGIDAGLPVCMSEATCARNYDATGGKPPQHMVDAGRAALQQSGGSK